MKKPLTITALLIAVACTPAPQTCERTSGMFAKDGTPIMVGEPCVIEPRYWPEFTPTWSNDNDDPDTTRVGNPDPSGPTDPTDPDGPSDPDTPDKPSDPTGPKATDKVKGNNGWGNGDQSAPGNSRDRNNAENGGRNQRNHGQANRN